jgi:hypothetical protein
VPVPASPAPGIACRRGSTRSSWWRATPMAAGPRNRPCRLTLRDLSWSARGRHPQPVHHRRPSSLSLAGGPPRVVQVRATAA